MIPTLGHTLFPAWADTRTATCRAFGYNGVVTDAPTFIYMPLSNKTFGISYCDGTYPRPERRGIAPVQRITDRSLLRSALGSRSLRVRPLERRSGKASKGVAFQWFWCGTRCQCRRGEGSSLVHTERPSGSTSPPVGGRAPAARDTGDVCDGVTGYWDDARRKNCIG